MSTDWTDWAAPSLDDFAVLARRAFDDLPEVFRQAAGGVLTRHDGFRSVAWLAILGVAATSISTTVWFPMVFATLDERREAPRQGEG